MKKLTFVLIVAAIALLVTLFAFKTYNESTTVDNTEVLEEVTDSTSEVLTPEGVLQFRELLRECQRVDSVYMSIPDVVLLAILINHGTDLSNTEIVTIYESNKDIYDIYLREDRVKEYIKHIVKTKSADTIYSKPDTACSKPDTTYNK